MRRARFVRAVLVGALLLLGVTAMQGCSNSACALSAPVEPRPPDINDILRNAGGCSVPARPALPTYNPPPNVRGH